MSVPTSQQITRFLEVFEKLSAFEAQHRFMRGWGAFPAAEPMPDPDVMAVLEWLRPRDGGKPRRIDG